MRHKSGTADYLFDITGTILDSAISVHKAMGPGLVESIYQECLVSELQDRELAIETMVPIPLVYKGKTLSKRYIIDILVEGEIILELKAVEAILPVHEAQIISYLKLSNRTLGFLINFKVPLLKAGFKRFINNLK
jgi:GxxExxY protein